MNIMPKWTTLDELEGANMKRNYKDRDGESLVKNFKYWQPFGFHIFFRHHLGDYNNRFHSPISLKRKWSNKYWTDLNFVW